MSGLTINTCCFQLEYGTILTIVLMLHCTVTLWNMWSLLCNDVSWIVYWTMIFSYVMLRIMPCTKYIVVSENYYDVLILIWWVLSADLYELPPFCDNCQPLFKTAWWVNTTPLLYALELCLSCTNPSMWYDYNNMSFHNENNVTDSSALSQKSSQFVLQNTATNSSCLIKYRWFSARKT